MSICGCFCSGFSRFQLFTARINKNVCVLLPFPVNSTSSGSSTKFDPDLLKADVALAKNRVARLHRDLDVARAEFAYQQRGVDMLSQ